MQWGQGHIECFPHGLHLVQMLLRAGVLIVVSVVVAQFSNPEGPRVHVGRDLIWTLRVLALNDFLLDID